MNVPAETGLLDDATIRPDGKKGYTPHEPPQLAVKGVPFSLQGWPCQLDSVQSEITGTPALSAVGGSVSKKPSLGRWPEWAPFWSSNWMPCS